MKKIIIWLLALGGGLAVILVAAVLLIPKFVDIESYKPEIEQKVAEATGRSFSLGGELNVSVFPWIGVSFSDLHLGNPEGYESRDFVKIKSFEVRVKLLPLLTKKIEVKKFVVDGPEIFLEKLSDGSVNWTTASKSSKTPPANAEKKEKKTEKHGQGADFSLSSLKVGEFSVINGRVTFVDNSLGQKNEITNITLTMQDVSLENPISLLFQANVDGRSVKVDGSVGPIGKKIGRGTVKMDLAVDFMQQFKVTLKGTFEDVVEKQKFQLALNIAPFSPRELFAVFGQQLPLKTTDPAVLDKVSLNLNIQGNPTSIILENSLINVDDSTLKLEAVVKDMAKPDVSFKLELDTINLDRYLPPPTEKKEQETSQTVSAKSGGKAVVADQKAKVDYTPLRGLVLDGEIKVGELIAHGVKVENFSMNIEGTDGIFDLDPFKVDLYKGSVAMVGKFNVTGDKPTAQIDLRLENIEVGPLLQDSMEKDVLEGTLGATVGITVAGDDVADIKKSLSGEGKLKFVDGAIVGIDLAGMMRNITSSLGADKPKEKPRTDFAELTVPFVLTDGVFKTLETRLSSPLLRLEMAGTANLVTEILNFKVRPKLVGTLKGQGDKDKHAGVTVPLLVEGTFAEPEYSLDLSNVVSEQALIDAASDPEGTAKKAKELSDTGEKLFKSFGFGN